MYVVPIYLFVRKLVFLRKPPFLTNIRLFLFMIFDMAGYYMYVDTSSLDTGAIGVDNNEKAHLQSSMYQHSGSACTLSLWYHMEGSTVGTVNIFLRTEDEVRQLISPQFIYSSVYWILNRADVS